MPKIIPNLYQSLFSGFKILEFNKPKNKNINETIKDQTLRSPASIKGHKEINKKTIKKNTPKFLFEGNFIFFSKAVYFITFSFNSKEIINSFHSLFDNPESLILIFSPLINF